MTRNGQPPLSAVATVTLADRLAAWMAATLPTWRGLVGLALLVLAAGLAAHAIGTALQARLGFDGIDIGVYYRSAAWVDGGGMLYRDVPSEYPPLANLIFAFVRVAGEIAWPGLDGFSLAWCVFSWCAYLVALAIAARGGAPLALMAWVAPGPIYYAVYRFDIYPVLATLIALCCIRRSAFLAGALWIGVAAALKGYALCLLPVYCVYLLRTQGLRVAVIAGALGVAPLAGSLLAVYGFADWDGVAYPFRFHAGRQLNAETVFDVPKYLTGVDMIESGLPVRPLAGALQLFCALAAAAARPKSFDALIHAMLFATMGFLTFLMFYSPQYVLWSLPFICFSGSRALVCVATVFAWISYLHFPVGEMLMIRYPRAFHVLVTVNAAIRLVIMAIAARRALWVPPRGPAGTPGTRPRPALPPAGHLIFGQRN